eukprot:SAG11_NODE_37343_length_257_cov_0.911392_1_plen_52_part_01
MSQNHVRCDRALCSAAKAGFVHQPPVGFPFGKRLDVALVCAGVAMRRRFSLR